MLSKSERNIVEERNGLGCTIGKILAGERPEGCQSVTVQSAVLGNICVVHTEKKCNTKWILARELHGRWTSEECKDLINGRTQRHSWSPPKREGNIFSTREVMGTPDSWLPW